MTNKLVELEKVIFGKPKGRIKNIKNAYHDFVKEREVSQLQKIYSFLFRKNR